MIEIWKDIPNYDGLYQVSNLGVVKSLTYCNQYGRIKKEKLLKQNIIKSGYCVVSITNKKRKTMPIHRLVAQTFITNPNNLPQVNHKDGNKQNNRVDNLEWCTNEYNMQHAKQNGLLEKRKLKIKVKQYDLNDKMIKQWLSAKDVWEELKINNSHITECCKGKRKTAGGYIWRYANDTN